MRFNFAVATGARFALISPVMFPDQLWNKDWLEATVFVAPVGICANAQHRIGRTIRCLVALPSGEVV